MANRPQRNDTESDLYHRQCNRVKISVIFSQRKEKSCAELDQKTIFYGVGAGLFTSTLRAWKFTEVLEYHCTLIRKVTLGLRFPKQEANIVLLFAS